MASSGEPLFACWVQKQGGMIKTWKQRYLVLRADGLAYYESDKSSNPKGTVQLSSIERVVDAPTVGARWPAGTPERGRFGVETEGRLFAVAALDVNHATIMCGLINYLLLQQADFAAEYRKQAASQLASLVRKSPDLVELLRKLGAEGILGRLLDGLAADSPVVASLKAVVAVLTDKDVAGTTVVAAASPAPAKLPPPPPPAPASTESSGAESAKAEESKPVVEPPSTSTEPDSKEHVKPVFDPNMHHGAVPSSEADDAAQTPAYVPAQQEAVNFMETCWKEIEQQVEAAEQRKAICVDERFGPVDVRVFVSSTFADMFSEREVLIRKVFPRLRAWAEPRGLNIIECDLRWGVPKESTSETVFRTCLGEIDRCIEVNTNPFFVNLLGERYGWVPINKEVPVSVRDEYAWVSNVSITHMEILHGAYRGGNPNALFCLRDPELVKRVPEAFQNQFVDRGELATTQLAALKEKLQQRFTADHILHYTGVVDGVESSTGMDKVKITLDRAFENTVYDFLVTAIDKQYPVMTRELSFLQELQAPHEEALAKTAPSVLGREAAVEQVLTFCRDSAAPGGPLLITGPSGTGKGAVLMAAASQARQAGMKVIFYSSRTSNEATSFGEAMALIALALDESVGKEKPAKEAAAEKPAGSEEPAASPESATATEEPAATGEGSQGTAAEEAQNTSSYVLSPKTRAVHEYFRFNLELAKVYRKCLEQAAAGDQRTVIFVEAADKLMIEEHIVSWEDFACHSQGNLRFVLSADPGYFCESLIKSAGKAAQPVVELPLQFLSNESRQELVARTLGRFNKRLDAEQMSLLVDNEGSSNVRWLKLVCEELRVFGVFETVTQRIRSLASDLNGVALQIWTRIKEEDESGLLARAAAFICVSRYGLFENELLELLGTPKQDEDGSWTYEPCLMADWAPQLQRMKPLLRTGMGGSMALLSKEVKEGISAEFAQLKAEDGSTPLLQHCRVQLRDYFLRKNVQKRLLAEIAPLLLQLSDKPNARRFYDDDEFWVRLDGGDRLALSNMLRCPNRLPAPAFNMPFLDANMCFNCALKRSGFAARYQTCAVCRHRLHIPATLNKKMVVKDKTFGDQLAYYCQKHRSTPPNSVIEKCCYCSNVLNKNFSTSVMICTRCSIGGARCFCTN